MTDHADKSIYTPAPKRNPCVGDVLVVITAVIELALLFTGKL
jgi:hypothetical protein